MRKFQSKLKITCGDEYQPKQAATEAEAGVEMDHHARIIKNLR
jgi:hypothetical protein